MKIKGLIFLVFALIYSVNLSAQILKGSSTLFFEQKAHMDAFSPNLPYGAELAFVLEDSTLYRWSRDLSEWTAYLPNKVYVIATAADTTTISDPRENDVAYVDSTLMFLRDTAAWLLFSGGTPLPDSLVYQSELEATIDTVVSGSGTSGYLALWNAARRLTDAPVSVSGNVVTVEGSGASLKLNPTTAPANAEGVIYANDAANRLRYMDGVDDHSLAYVSELTTNNTSTNYLPFWDGDSFENSQISQNAGAGFLFFRGNNNIFQPAVSGQVTLELENVDSKSLYIYLDRTGTGRDWYIISEPGSSGNSLEFRPVSTISPVTLNLDNLAVDVRQRLRVDNYTGESIGTESSPLIIANTNNVHTGNTAVFKNVTPLTNSTGARIELANTPISNTETSTTELGAILFSTLTIESATIEDTDAANRATGAVIDAYAIEPNAITADSVGSRIRLRTARKNTSTIGSVATFDYEKSRILSDTFQVDNLPNLASPTYNLVADANGVLHSTTPSHATLKETTSQALASTATYTHITSLDTTGVGKNVTRTDSTITVQTAGTYRITYNFSIEIAAAGGGTWLVQFQPFSNAAAIAEMLGTVQVVTGGAETWRQVVSGETIIDLSASDVISLRYTATAGPTYTLYPGTITLEKL